MQYVNTARTFQKKKVESIQEMRNDPFSITRTVSGVQLSCLGAAQDGYSWVCGPALLTDGASVAWARTPALSPLPPGPHFPSTAGPGMEKVLSECPQLRVPITRKMDK